MLLAWPWIVAGQDARTTIGNWAAVVGDSVMVLPTAGPATFNATLAQAVNRPLFALDLKTLPPSSAIFAWLAGGKPLVHGFFEGDPTASFDALIFVKTIHPVRVLR